MSRLRLNISMSLDGYVAGPEQSLKEPLGIGGEQLHEWIFPLTAWRAPHGLKAGEVNESSPVVGHTLTNIGATIPVLLGGGERCSRAWAPTSPGSGRSGRWPRRR
jgi:hypothetical protein